MPPKKLQFNPHNRSLKKIKVLKIKKSDQPSLLSEHFSLALGILFAVLTFLLMGFGMRWDASVIIALWITVIIFFARQLHRYFKGKRAPEAEKKKQVVLAEPVKEYKPPEVPRVSKDFSPTPPAGDKRYPPPSPFIKPPK